MKDNPAVLDSAPLSWDGENPKSELYNDIYYSRDDGLAESSYVFIQSNRIEERLSNGKESVTIFETGFGTGLNFLNTLRTYDNCENPSPLNFISVEKYPLKKSDIEKALSAYPELSKDVEGLVAQYPLPTKGLKTLRFRNSRVKLHLLWADIQHALSNYSPLVDAWFLDGFNPSENQEMWDQGLFNYMANHSKPGASFATFTAAGFIRRGLQNAGFEVVKQKGFGKKREMLVGHWLKETKLLATNQSSLPKWAEQEPSQRLYLKCNNKNSSCTPPTHKQLEYDVAIVGAGIAGINTAKACADQGLRCLIIEKESQPMSGGSGQHYLTTYSKLPAEWNQEARLASFLLEYSQRHYAAEQRDARDQFWDGCGQLQLDWNDKEIARSTKRQTLYTLPESLVKRVEAAEAAEISGTHIEKPGWWFSQSGALNPKRYSEHVLRHPLISIQYNFEVLEIDNSSKEQVWQVSDSDRSIRARNLVYCNSYSAIEHQYFNHLPTKTIRGQASKLSNSSLDKTKCIVCGEGYLYRDLDGNFHVGSTYQLNQETTEIISNDHHDNLDKLSRWLPGFGEPIDKHQQTLEGKAGLRCTTPDYNPIVGPAPIFEEMKNKFGKLREDKKACSELYGSYHPGLYLNIGHGSKGLVTSAGAAHHLANLISGGISPLNSEATEMIHPARFIIRYLSQRRI